MARTILSESNLPKIFGQMPLIWHDIIMNRALIRLVLNKNPCELYYGRQPSISHLHLFGCKCYIHNNGKDNLDKFDPKSDEGWLL